MLNSLAGWSVRHRWMVVGGWVAAVVSCIILAGAFGGDSITDFADDDRTESGRALATMNAAGGGSAADEARVVFAVDPSVAGGIDNAEVRAEVDALRERITEIDPTTRMADLYATGLSRNVAISPDRRVAYTTLTVESDSDNERNALVEKIKDTATEFDADGVRLSFAGDWFADVAPAGVGEAIGLGLAMIILLIAFGTVVAAGLPLLTALFGVGVGASILILLQNVIETPDFAVSLAAMLGIGVGIDYALLILTRFRSALADGHDVPEAIISAMNTAGRAVVFAGATVTIAIAGLLTQGGVIGPTMTLAGCAGVLAVLVAALTLLPALLAIVGTRVNRLAVPGLRTTPGSEGALAQRWSKIVQRHPYLGVLSALIILGIMLIPAYDLHLGFGDAGNRATSDTTRIAYDDLARGFGDGSNGPLFLVAELPDNPDNGDKLAALAAELDTTDGVASVSPPIGVGSVDGNEVTMLIVTPTTGPQEAATLDLVHHIRDDIVPSSGLPIEMTGATVGGSDFAELTLQRLPLIVHSVGLGIPITGGAGQSYHHESVVVGGILRRDRRGLPMGLGDGTHRGGQSGSDRGLGADRAVRRGIRLGNGLRGVLGFTHPGAIPHDRQPHHVGDRRPGGNSEGDHRSRSDHGLRLCQLHLLRRSRSQGHGAGAGGGSFR